MDRLLRDSMQCIVVGEGKENIPPAAGFPSIIQKNRIHHWLLSYEGLDRHYKVLSDLISAEEWHAASLFRNEADSRKYILRHGVLRIILSNYTCQGPERISFFYGKNGKPELDCREGYNDVSFNLSHTSEMVFIGITRKQRIGIDIVKMDPWYHYQDIAEYILTPAEKTCMQKIEPVMKYQVFFRIWALKEAILKATGDSLSAMKDTDTSEIILKGCVVPCGSVKFRNSLSPFFIWQFTSGDGYCGAIAAETGLPARIQV